MLTIGAHLSASKGFLSMGKEALSINANTFQFFTRNPRGGKAKEINTEDVAAFRALWQENQGKTVLAHAPYTANVCSAKEATRNFAKEIMADDLKRMEYLPHNLYNFHPGSHTGQGIETGITQITEALNALLREEQTTTVLLETMARKGTEVGGTFEELAKILNGVTLQEKMGVCLDTCHVFDSGYDIKNHLDDVLESFAQTIGIEKLRAIHINDSMYGFESHKDRHAKIGEGELGLEALIRIINHPQLRHLPFFLETPNDVSGYGEEIALLRGYFND